MGAARVAAVLERLFKAAGADITRLLEEDTAAFDRELRRRDERIAALQKRLRVTETELRRARALLRLSPGAPVRTAHAETLPHRKEPAPVSHLQNFSTRAEPPLEEEKPPQPETAILRPHEHRAGHAPGGRDTDHAPGGWDLNHGPGGRDPGHTSEGRNPNPASGGWDPNHAMRGRDPNHAMGGRDPNLAPEGWEADNAPGGWDSGNAPRGWDLGHAPGEENEFSCLGPHRAPEGHRSGHAPGDCDPNHAPGGHDPGHAPVEDDEFSSLEFEMKIEQVEELVDQELSLQRHSHRVDPASPKPDSSGTRVWQDGGGAGPDRLPTGAEPRQQATFPSVDLQGRGAARDTSKPFCCDECGKGFTQRTRLITHRRTHTGERPYHCQHCGKMFSRQDNCLRHVRLHSGQRW